MMKTVKRLNSKMIDFSSMVGDFLTREYSIEGVKHFKIFHIISVDNNVLIGELFQSIDGMHVPDYEVDGLKLEGAEKKGFRKSSDIDIFTFNLWKGKASDEDLKMYGQGRPLPPFKKKGDSNVKNQS